MSLTDLIRKPLRRLNPRRGMVVNVETWSEAHGYHRIHQRLHVLAMHRPGIVVGLEVTAWNPPDNTVVVSPGVALDPEGNIIIVGEAQRLSLQTHEEGYFYLLLRYREVPEQMSRSPASVDYEPTYLLEGYSIEIRPEIPDGANVELARIQLSGTGGAITDPATPDKPGPHEIDYRFRPVSGTHSSGGVGIGLIPLEDAPNMEIRHLTGALRIVQAINATAEYHATFRGPVTLNQEINNCQLLLISGEKEFSLNPEGLNILSNFLDRGGVLFGEACGADADSGSRPLPFQQSFLLMAEQLGRRLTSLERKDALLADYYLFAEAPTGMDGPVQLVASNGIIYSTGDYGCMWAGGRLDKWASREAIRSATELGVNIGVHAVKRTRLRSSDWPPTHL